MKPTELVPSPQLIWAEKLEASAMVRVSLKVAMMPETGVPTVPVMEGLVTTVRTSASPTMTVPLAVALPEISEVRTTTAGEVESSSV